jgi:Helix-turn-helix of DDE superfamily endonuclease
LKIASKPIMSQFAKYKSKPPAVFSRMVGVPYGTFMLLLAKLEAAFNDYQSEQLTRKRGKKCSIPLADQLLLCLLYLRAYDTFLNLSFQFGISESYAQKRYTFVKKLLLQALDLPDEESLRDAINGEHVAVDVTEQAIERPIENQEQYYSGKKKYIR